jgi:hypothetical protein
MHHLSTELALALQLSSMVSVLSWHCKRLVMWGKYCSGVNSRCDSKCPIYVDHLASAL